MLSYRSSSHSTMSLFGTSPDEAPISSNRKSNLFSEEAAGKSTSGLFADEPGASDESPWGFQPTPKKQSRGNLVRTLLPAGDVPESYIDAFDAMIANGQRTDGGVSSSGVQKLLQDSRLGADDQQRIVNIVSPQGADGLDGMGRGEFHVLLALIGLAQEGEELSLDSVDERRRSLCLQQLRDSIAPANSYARATSTRVTYDQEAPGDTSAPAAKNAGSRIHTSTRRVHAPG